MDKPTLDTYYLSHLRPHFLKLFETKINPAFVIDVFHKYNLNVLTEKDKSLIKAETRNRGEIAGSALLFERLACYDGWYSCLLKVLRDREVQLAYVAEEMEEIKKLLESRIFEKESDVDQILLTKCRVKLENEENKNKRLENIARENECALQQYALKQAEMEEKLKAYHHENTELKNKLEASHEEAYTHKAMVIDLRRMLENEETKNKQLLLQSQTLENSVKESRCADDEIVAELENVLATIDIPSKNEKQQERLNCSKTTPPISPPYLGNFRPRFTLTEAPPFLVSFEGISHHKKANMNHDQS